MMSFNEHLIQNLKSQQMIIENLIQQLEVKADLDESDFQLYDHTTKRIENNLQQLRKWVQKELLETHE